MFVFGRKAKRMLWGKRLFGKSRRDLLFEGKAARTPHRYFRPSFEPLEERRLLAASAFDWEADFLPGNLTYSGSVSGEIASELEKDVYSLDFDADQTITAVVQGDAGLQAAVYIRNAQGTILSQGTASANGAVAVAQTAAVNKTGGYTIEVVGLSDSIGQYTIEVITNSAVELEARGISTNNTRATAQSIEASFCELSGGAAYCGAVMGVLTDDAADNDWFSFTLAVDQSVTLVAAADPDYEQTTGNDGRPFVEFYDSQGTRLAVGIDSDIPTNCGYAILASKIENFVADAAGTYYLRVSGQDLAYSLVASKDCALDLGNNSGTTQEEGTYLSPWEDGAYQDITGQDGVLGEVGAGGSGWTFMVYVDADNNLEGAGIADFLEMAAVGSTSEVNIVVQMDRIGGYDFSYGNWTTARRGLVLQGDVPDANWGQDIGEVDMGSADTAIDFIEWAMREYPAGNYAFIYWDHGSGIEGICTDYTSGNYLTMADLSQVVAAVPEVDIVGFDACMMAMLEVGYQYADGADILVSSEASEWLDGWEYNNFLDKLVADPSMSAPTLASHIIDAFQARYDPNADSTLSAVDLTQMSSISSSLIAGLDAFAQWMINSAATADWNAVSSASGLARRWDEPAFVDLGDFISRVNQAAISTELASITSSLLVSLESVVIDAYHGAYAACTGLSIYLPYSSGYISSAYNQSLDFLADTHWDDFVSYVGSSKWGTQIQLAATGKSFDAFSFFVERKSSGDESDFDRIAVAEPGEGSPQTSDGNSFSGSDWYCVEMKAGDWVTFWTTTPGSNNYGLQNLLDPYLELYGPDGQLLASDDNTVYGRNALITHTAAVAGRYWIRVASSPLVGNTMGQYYLRIIGPSGNAEPLGVSATDLPAGVRQDEQPTYVEVKFTEPILLTSLDYSDLKIDGEQHSVGCSVIDGSTIRFKLPADLADGSHVIGFATGAITDLQGSPIEETYWTFYLGPAPPQIISTSIHAGDDFPAGISLFTAIFDQPLNAAALDPSDVVLSGTTSGNVQILGVSYDPDAYTVTVEFTPLAADSYTLTLLSGDGSFENSEGLDLDGETGDGPNGLPTGDGNAGGNFSISFSTCDGPRVLGRYVFYNNSAWDGNDAAAGSADDQAIAADKQALLPGETAAFKNYTSYARGINGIIIDVGFLPDDVELGLSDFRFLVGNKSNTASWAAAPDPISITVRRGEGVNGSDRVTIIWADGAIAKKWLQVTLFAARLGLAGDDVFYWGNAVGESGDSTAQALVNAADVMAVRNNATATAAVSNPYDFNRDGLVDESDAVTVQSHTTSPFSALRLITTPEPVETAPRGNGFAPPQPPASQTATPQTPSEETPPTEETIVAETPIVETVAEPSSPAAQPAEEAAAAQPAVEDTAAEETVPKEVVQEPAVVEATVEDTAVAKVKAKTPPPGLSLPAVAVDAFFVNRPKISTAQHDSPLSWKIQDASRLLYAQYARAHKSAQQKDDARNEAAMAFKLVDFVISRGLDH